MLRGPSCGCKTQNTWFSQGQGFCQALRYQLEHNSNQNNECIDRFEDLLHCIPLGSGSNVDKLNLNRLESLLQHDKFKLENDFVDCFYNIHSCSMLIDSILVIFVKRDNEKMYSHYSPCIH